MKTDNHRSEILYTLYNKKAWDSLHTLDCEGVARLIEQSWEKIEPDVSCLVKKKYIVLKHRQIRTRIFCTMYLTAEGVDFVESEIITEKSTKKTLPSISFKLQLSLRGDSKFEVRALETPMGEPRFVAQLPYSSDELTTILRALRMFTYEANRFRPEQRHILEHLGLLHNSNFIPDLIQRVGQTLYEALIIGDVHTAFQMALNQARVTSSSVSVQLRFDEDSTEIARYPWELLYHRRPLLPSRAIELTRYINFPETVTALPVAQSLRLLYIESRPTDLSALPNDSEQITVQQGLQGLQEENILKVDLPERSTYESLLNYLEANEVHIIHFDGHGVFACLCPNCKSMNYSHLKQCAVCNREITDIKPQGYLAFEDMERHVHWISSETLGTLLYNRSLGLVVLSACRSSSIGGETLFGGTAPALIQAGIPAIVSMQLPISVNVAIRFMDGFYRALARFESIPTAVNAGRTRTIDTKEWFIPTLYLRSRDDKGNLFTQQ